MNERKKEIRERKKERKKAKDTHLPSNEDAIRIAAKRPGVFLHPLQGQDLVAEAPVTGWDSSSLLLLLLLLRSRSVGVVSSELLPSEEAKHVEPVFVFCPRCRVCESQSSYSYNTHTAHRRA